MKENILLVGGGGHCKSCIDVIEVQAKFNIIGIVDKKEKPHQKILDYEIIAGDTELPKFVREKDNFLITIGQIKNSDRRKELFTFLKGLKSKFPVIVSPSAYVSERAFVDEGTIVMHRAFINANAYVGKNCIINTGTIIEHDAKIGDHCHISTGSIINGECNIGEGTFVGSNSVIANNVDIAKEVVIGAGSVVVKSIEKSGVYVGIPAREVSVNA